MAKVVNLLGWGGQRLVESILGWNRKTIRKGQKEIDNGVETVDRFHARGRKRIEHHFPNLLDDIKDIVNPVSQTDPTFRSTRIYSPLTAKGIIRRLIEDKSYNPSDLPVERTISNKLLDLGFRPQRVKKCKPQKKLPETDSVFETVFAVNKRADNDPETIRISIDCKAAVKIGPFSRGGKNRIEQKASDHDFEAEETITPFGIFLPELCESHLWFSVGPATADFMADRIEDLWEKLSKRFPRVKRLVINADNGPECSGRRTQWLKRLVELSDKAGITIELAYYPPYHSKYNPIERLWGVLENHWRGELLTSIEKTLGLARTMTYKGIVPSTVRLIRKVYKKGVRLSKKQMRPIQKRMAGIEGLEKYFFSIASQPILG